MGKKFVVSKTIEFAAGEEADKTVHTVRAAKLLKLKRVIFAFPSGQAFNLQAYFKYGIAQTIPDEGYYAGDSNSYTSKCDFTYESGLDVVIHGKNLDTTTAQKVHVTLEGEIE